jgi:hypothetical protein
MNSRSHSRLVDAIAASTLIPEVSSVIRLLKTLAVATIPPEPLHDLDDQKLCVAALEYYRLVVQARKLILTDEFTASEGADVVERWTDDDPAM